MSLRIQNGMSVVVRFPYGDFKEKDSKDGKAVDYLYTVEVNGAKDYLYADKKLHRLLQDAGMRKGAKFTVSRSQDGWKVTPVGNPPASSQVPSAEPGSQEADLKGAETTASEASRSEVLAGGLFGLMARCLRESLKAWQWLGESFTADNVQACGNALFIECNRRGIVLPPIPYPDPEQMLTLARIGDELVPEQRERLEKMIFSGMTWVEAQAIIDYYQEKQGQKKAA